MFFLLAGILFLTFLLIITNFIIYSALGKIKTYDYSEHDEVKISVVVAAKNEEEKIASLIRALRKQDFPIEKYEVIIVDDNSEDNTYERAIELIKDLENFNVIKANKKDYPAKKGALSEGIKLAKFPNIMITDADCLPKEYWLFCYSANFLKGFDLLFGAAPLIQKKNIVNKIACFENLRSHILTFSMAKKRFPYSAAARSFGFTKQAFEQLGGYSNTLETYSGDDDLLIREAVKNKMKIGVVTHPSAFVYSDTKEKYEDYLAQKGRHTSTSHHYLFRHKLFLGFWHSVNILLIASALLGIFDNVFLLPLFLKLLVDLLILSTYQKLFGYCFTTFEMLFLQISYEIHLIIHYFRSFSKGKKWN